MEDRGFTVDTVDYDLAAACLGATEGMCMIADLDDNGTIDAIDTTIIVQRFDQPPGPSAFAPLPTARP